MAYKVHLTKIAERQLDDIIFYTINVLKNIQAAINVWEDALQTIQNLEYSAGAFSLCQEDELSVHGYRRVHFKNHDYLMLYLIEGDTVYIDRIYHELQDYKNLPH